MNYTVQELALQYAESMIRFYQAQDRYHNSLALGTKEFEVIYDDFTDARFAMYEIQERLAVATKRQAVLLNSEV